MAAEQPQILAVVEVGKCKRLWQDPDAPLVSSPSVSLTLEDTTLTTNIMQETADPFYNEAFEFKVPTSLNEQTAEIGHKELTWWYRVVDTQFEPPRVIGEGELKLACSNSKGETTLDLHTRDAPEGEEARGIILFRYKIALPKPKVFDPVVDLRLTKIPKFSASFELVPNGAAVVSAPSAGGAANVASNRRTWSLFLETSPSNFREAFERRLVESFKEEKSERKHPTKTPNDVVSLRWKCKRSHQFLTRIRLTAERFLAGASLGPITQEDDTTAKLRWKELAYVHASQAQFRTPKVTELIDRLWLFYCDGVDYRTPMSHISFEHRTKMQMTPFGKKEYESLTACVLQLFMPGLSATMCDGLSKEEWETDPASNKKALQDHEEHMAGLQQAADADIDNITKMAAKQLEELMDPVVTSAGIPTVNSDHFKLFDSMMRKYCDLWCETFTDAEALAFLKGIAPAIPTSRARLNAAAAASLDVPKSGRGMAGSRRRSSVKEPRSPRSPRTPRK